MVCVGAIIMSTPGLLKNPGKIKKAQPGGFNWVNPGLNGFYWAGG